MQRPISLAEAGRPIKSHSTRKSCIKALIVLNSPKILYLHLANSSFPFNTWKG